MDYLLITYLAYITITLVLTFWVGNTLFTNGKIFLLEIFDHNEELVNSINKLLLIGFYLINFGFALHNLITRAKITSAVESVEKLSQKIGVIIITLGIMHFMNLLVLFKMRSKSKTPRTDPDEAPLPTSASN